MLLFALQVLNKVRHFYGFDGSLAVVRIFGTITTEAVMMFIILENCQIFDNHFLHYQNMYLDSDMFFYTFNFYLFLIDFDFFDISFILFTILRNLLHITKISSFSISPQTQVQKACVLFFANATVRVNLADVVSWNGILLILLSLANVYLYIVYLFVIIMLYISKINKQQQQNKT